MLRILRRTGVPPSAVLFWATLWRTLLINARTFSAECSLFICEKARNGCEKSRERCLPESSQRALKQPQSAPPLLQIERHLFSFQWPCS